MPYYNSSCRRSWYWNRSNLLLVISIQKQVIAQKKKWTLQTFSEFGSEELYLRFRIFVKSIFGKVGPLLKGVIKKTILIRHFTRDLIP